MGFSFPLQALLNWKQSLEEYCQMRLAEIIARLRAQEQEIEKLTLKRLSYEQKLKEKSQQGIGGEEYRLYKQFAEDSRRDLLSKEERKRGTLREIDKEREKLVTLTKEKKILEKLKEKQFKNFMYQAERAEQKQNDEMTTMKYQPSSRRRTS
jgi:flagellar FliJ protein